MLSTQTTLRRSTILTCKSS